MASPIHFMGGTCQWTHTTVYPIRWELTCTHSYHGTPCSRPLYYSTFSLRPIQTLVWLMPLCLRTSSAASGRKSAHQFAMINVHPSNCVSVSTEHVRVIFHFNFASKNRNLAAWGPLEFLGAGTRRLTCSSCYRPPACWLRLAD